MKKVYSLFLIFVLAQMTVSANVIYVNVANSNPTQDGTSWGTAFADLQGAIEAATSGDSIWVAAATYFPTAGAGRERTFNFNKNVKIYGGFIGTEVALEQRDFENNTTTLSGNLGVLHDWTDNAFHVITWQNGNALLDGFSIVDGNSDGAPFPATGAAIVAIGPTITVLNSIFSNHRGTEYNSGAIYVGGGSGVIHTIDNCSFINNYSACFYGFSDAAITVNMTQCLFSNNFSDKQAPIDFFARSGKITLNIDSTEFSSNTKFFPEFHNEAGAINGLVDHELDLNITNTIIRNNAGTSSGGIDLYNRGGEINMWIDQSRITENLGTEYNGSGGVSILNDGVLNLKVSNTLVHGNFRYLGSDHGAFIRYNTRTDDSSNIAIENSIFYNSGKVMAGSAGDGKLRTEFNNVTVANSNQVAFTSDNSNYIFNNCIFYNNGNSPFGSGKGILHSNNIILDAPPVGSGTFFDIDPQFADSANGDFSLLSCSPAINSGDSSFSGNDSTDYAGNSRIFGKNIDLGALEFQSNDTTDLPEINLGDDKFVCLGDSVRLIATGNAKTYIWSNGTPNGDFYTPLETEKLTVIGLDEIGCKDTSDLEVVVQYFYISSQVYDEINSEENGRINLEVNGNGEEYEYDWNNDGLGDFDDDKNLKNLSAGEYIVVVMDDIGCIQSDTFNIGRIYIGIDSKDQVLVKVYPNPASDFIQLEFNKTETGEVRLIDAIGKTVYAETVVGKTHRISISQFPKGIYLVEYQSGKSRNSAVVLIK